MASGRSMIAVVALTAALLGASTMTTGANWRDAVSLDGGDLGSGSLTLLNGSASSQVRNYAFTALAGTALGPGSTVQAPLQMRNAGASALAYRLNQTTTTGSTALITALTLRIQRVAGPSNCATGSNVAAATGSPVLVYDGPLAGAGSTEARVLDAGASETLCVRVVLPTSASTNTQGSGAQAVLTFEAVET